MSPSPSSAAYASSTRPSPTSERFEIFAHEVHHGIDGEAADLRQPDRFRLFQPAPAIAGRERLAHGNQIVPRIEALGNVPDHLPARLAVAGMDGASERVHLRAGVVHVVFPRHGKAHMGEKIGERIAHDCASGMPDVERPRGVSGNIFHVDAPTLTQVIGTVSAPSGKQLSQPRPPEIVGQPQIDEAGAGHLDRAKFRALLQPLRQILGNLARLAARLFGQDQRRIAGRIAVFRLARRLHQDGRKIEPDGQCAGIAHPLNFSANNLRQVTEDIHLHSTVSKRFRCS